MRSCQVDRQRLVPEGVVEVDHRTWVGTAADARVVDENLDRPKGALDIGDDLLRDGPIAEVCGEGRGRSSGGTNLSDDCVEFAGRARGQGHACSFSGVGQGDGAADAAAGAGYQ